MIAPALARPIVSGIGGGVDKRKSDLLGLGDQGRRRVRSPTPYRPCARYVSAILTSLRIAHLLQGLQARRLIGDHWDVGHRVVTETRAVSV